MCTLRARDIFTLLLATRDIFTHPLSISCGLGFAIPFRSSILDYLVVPNQFFSKDSIFTENVSGFSITRQGAE